MSGRLISNRLVLLLAGIAVVLLVATCGVLGLEAVLGAMGDETGSLVLRWIAAGLAVALFGDLVCLVLGLAVHAAESQEGPPNEPQAD